LTITKDVPVTQSWK